MLAKTHSISLLGLSGRAIEIEADISSNLPAFVLVGLPDASVNEAASRVRAAATNSKLPLPGRRITVNLSPASVPKHGSSYDLAIAVAVLAASGYFPASLIESSVFIGELALDGRIKPVLGVLAAVVAARRLGFTKIIVPRANLLEASVVKGIQVAAYDHLTQLAADFGVNVPVVTPAKDNAAEVISTAEAPCFSEVLGQDEAIQALTLSAIGGHHALLVGQPGAGKTMLASRLPGILPELSEEAAIEVGAIHSLARQGKFALNQVPPFQAPHHTASMVSMVGGGSGHLKPGLVSLAHRGVLFLDEAPEFQSAVLEALRQPLESGKIVVSRASGHATFPARFQLVLAMNPCPCGYAIGSGRNCTCSQVSKTRYSSKISGPLSDRIDLRLELESVGLAALNQATDEKPRSSEAIRSSVTKARQASANRLAKTPWQLNSEVAGSYLRRELRLGKATTKQLDTALDRRLISMRGYDRSLRLAWSIADFQGRTVPSAEDLAMATFLRGTEL
jgi:magnesium chelatase family protein